MKLEETTHCPKEWGYRNQIYTEYSFPGKEYIIDITITRRCTDFKLKSSN